MLQSGAHVGNRDFEEAKRCAKEGRGSGVVPGGVEGGGAFFFFKNGWVPVFLWVFYGFSMGFLGFFWGGQFFFFF